MLDPAPADLGLRTLALLLGLVGLALATLLVVRRRSPEAARHLGVRLGSLTVLMAALLVPAWLGPWPFAVVLAVLVALAAVEFAYMARAAGLPISPFGTGIPTATVVAGAAVSGVVGALVTIAAGALIAALSTRLAHHLAYPADPELNPVEEGGSPEPSGAGAASLLAGLGVVYIGLLAFLLLIRMQPNGFGRLVWILVVVQLGDVFALLGGMLLGRRRLAPRLSPGKTWEGLAVGVLAAVAGGLLFRYALPGLPAATLAALAAAAAVVGLAGDLSASAWKRFAGIKDFGRLMPGHGGVLDRFDSYLLAGPFAWAVYLLLP